MALDSTIKNAVVAAARQAGIEPAALLAVVEIESAGRPFEEDGRTPRLLFERHVFYRELKKRAPGKLHGAVDRALAIPKWSRATQYRDQGTSAGRLKLIDTARAIDLECANRSASWGLGQTMGFNAEGLGYKNATDMVTVLTTGGVVAQVDAMVREIKRNRLEQRLAQRDWAGFARGYNGPGYAANSYDVKLAAAYRKWRAALDPNDPETGATPVDLPVTRNAEPAPMSQSPIGNGAIVAGGATTAGGAIVVLDKINDVPDGAWDAIGRFLSKPNGLVAAGFLLLAIGACAFIWWRRKQMKITAGI